MSQTSDPIKEQFDTPSNFPYPPDYKKPLWTYQHAYPQQGSSKPDWLGIDYKKKPKDFVEAVRKNILDGNVASDGHLRVSDNWYHAPWLHYGDYGREPISGLKYAGAVAPRYIAENQNRYIQCWLNSYFNDYAASILYAIWGDGTKEPTWTSDLKFPIGSLIFETVFCDASDKEIYTLKGSPTADACIIDQPALPNEEPDIKKRGKKAKNLKVDTLHLIQTDFAARVNTNDNEIGWVFGTLIHDGTVDNSDPRARWNHLIPVGLEWGNDPKLTQDAHDDGKSSDACWINTKALDLINSFRGDRPWLGWHGRLNGPVDNFMSTCTSCHATAQLDTRKKAERVEISWIQDPPPTKAPGVAGQPGVWVQRDTKTAPKWFEDLPAGNAWDSSGNYLSADYNRHVQFAYQNYRDWDEKRKV